MTCRFTMCWRLLHFRSDCRSVRSPLTSSPPRAADWLVAQRDRAWLTACDRQDQDRAQPLQGHLTMTGGPAHPRDQPLLRVMKWPRSNDPQLTWRHTRHRSRKLTSSSYPFNHFPYAGKLPISAGWSDLISEMDEFVSGSSIRGVPIWT